MKRVILFVLTSALVAPGFMGCSDEDHDRDRREVRREEIRDRDYDRDRVYHDRDRDIDRARIDSCRIAG